MPSQNIIDICDFAKQYAKDNFDIKVDERTLDFGDKELLHYTHAFVNGFYPDKNKEVSTIYEMVLLMQITGISTSAEYEEIVSMIYISSQIASRDLRLQSANDGSINDSFVYSTLEYISKKTMQMGLDEDSDTMDSECESDSESNTKAPYTKLTNDVIIDNDYFVI